MQLVRTATRIAQLLGMRAPPRPLDIDLSTLSAFDALADDMATQPLVAPLQERADEPLPDARALNNPWRTQPGVRYRL